MKIGIMQPYFFPYLGYWQLINAVDRYVIYDDVNFIKNGWINRNNILLGGNKFLLSLPLECASSSKLINETKITSNIKQKEKLLKTVEAAYKKAPFFELVYPIVKNTIMFDSRNIAESLTYSIEAILSYLDIHTELIVSSKIDKNSQLKAEKKVIHIVKVLGGSIYINAIGGQELYNKNEFSDNGIDLKFIKMNEVKYNQFKNDFVPNLSIIDVIMFNTPEKVKELLDEYTLF